MTNSYIQVPPDSTGKKLDTEQLVVGGATVERERNQIAGANDDDIAVVTGADPSAGDHGIVTRVAPPTNPKTSAASDSAVAAGSSTDLDSTQIGSGNVGQLLLARASSSVPFKAVLKTVSNAVETVIETAFGRRIEFRYPHKSFVTVAQDAGVGFDGFRVSCTNLDTSQPADIHAAFLWDEI